MGFQRSIKKTIRMVQKNGNTCDRCIRGIEHMISPGHLEQVRINRDCVHFGVFKEQHRQRMLGIIDREEIRKVSLTASQWARNKARMQGAVDETRIHKRHGTCFATM
eukprot:5488338-Ditylum_brightwellii.AAC.1